RTEACSIAYPQQAVRPFRLHTPTEGRRFTDFRIFSQTAVISSFLSRAPQRAEESTLVRWIPLSSVAYSTPMPRPSFCLRHTSCLCAREHYPLRGSTRGRWRPWANHSRSQTRWPSTQLRSRGGFQHLQWVWSPIVLVQLAARDNWPGSIARENFLVL